MIKGPLYAQMEEDGRPRTLQLRISDDEVQMDVKAMHNSERNAKVHLDGELEKIRWPVTVGRNIWHQRLYGE